MHGLLNAGALGLMAIAISGISVDSIINSLPVPNCHSLNDFFLIMPSDSCPDNLGLLFRLLKTFKNLKI